MSFLLDKSAEWLEADGLGGFASGTALGVRTRRYHALLLSAISPPTGRVALVSGLEAWLEMDMGNFPLTSQMYFPGVLSPNGASNLESFEISPWPRWIYRLPYGMSLKHELFVPKGSSRTVLSWELVDPKGQIQLKVRPLLSARDYHSLQHENKDFRLDAQAAPGKVTWTPYPALPSVTALFNGEYSHQPDWYRQFLYEKEQERGLDFLEDLASPGVFQWDLTRGRAVLLLKSSLPGEVSTETGKDVEKIYEGFRSAEEKRRKAFSDPWTLAADSYFARRGKGETVIAGYPWFTDWGRDTFVSIRGLGLATGRLAETREILLEWAKSISQGMVPNRFPDLGEEPEYHSVDASLWYVIAVHDYLSASLSGKVSPGDWDEFRGPLEEILNGYSQGTRWGIRMDEDGLLWSGEGDESLTWMDARVGGKAVTPRVGKPVEVQALWLNALWVGSHFSDKWNSLFQKGFSSFQDRFWNGAGEYLYDVVDVNRQPSTGDASIRPNQVFAVGGLPLVLLDQDKAWKVLQVVESKLLTPFGLRSLAPGQPGYRRRYQGSVSERDNAYHQGTVWPWLLGPFVEAWVRVRGNSREAKDEAKEKFLKPLLENLRGAGLGHLPELTDAEAPYLPKGCPFQAWSLGEAIRLREVVLK